ncbi:MAG: ModD protein [Duodenibacillus sp.]
MGEHTVYFVSDVFLAHLIEEDIPYGDATVRLLGIENVPGKITCFPKEDCVVSGITLAERLFRMTGLAVERLAEDGERIAARVPVLRATGTAGAIHAVYKTAQNVMEYCSGISTRARAMVDAAQAVHPACQVVTTRKHFPGTKTLALYAAQAGGALVHRMGLSESILVFDQHRVFTDPAMLEDIAALRTQDPERKIAVEAGNLEEALTFARSGADIVQCERFTPDEVRILKAALTQEKCHTLVSAAGGVNATNAANYAAAGADFLVTTAPYFGRPADIKMLIERQ